MRSRVKPLLAFALAAAATAACSSSAGDGTVELAPGDDRAATEPEPQALFDLGDGLQLATVVEAAPVRLSDRGEVVWRGEAHWLPVREVTPTGSRAWTPCSARAAGASCQWREQPVSAENLDTPQDSTVVGGGEGGGGGASSISIGGLDSFAPRTSGKGQYAAPGCHRFENHVQVVDGRSKIVFAEFVVSAVGCTEERFRDTARGPQIGSFLKSVEPGAPWSWGVNGWTVTPPQVYRENAYFDRPAACANVGAFLPGFDPLGGLLGSNWAWADTAMGAIFQNAGLRKSITAVGGVRVYGNGSGQMWASYQNAVKLNAAHFPGNSYGPVPAELRTSWVLPRSLLVPAEAKVAKTWNPASMSRKLLNCK